MLNVMNALLRPCRGIITNFGHAFPRNWRAFRNIETARMFNNMAPIKVAIIGSGAGGLTAIKCCIDAGLQPTCFEQQSWLGGVWRYSDEVLPNTASVHRSTVTNTSKLMTAFSDFPMPKEFPNYLPQRKLQKYLELYAQHFRLEQHIHFNTTVVSLVKSEDHSVTGRWVISYRRQNDTSSVCDGICVESFDAVMVCIGHCWDQVKPKIPGIEKFKGVQVHSGDYRTFHPFVGKRVVVVGCGNSAGDVASELSRHASQIYLSTRSGCYVVERIGPKGRPVDFGLTRALQKVPKQIRRFFLSRMVYGKYNLVNFGLEPVGTLGITKFPIINDVLPHGIITGSIIVRHNVTEITETAVVFDGEDTVDNVDAIVFCTGFKLNFPFAKDICIKEDCYASLYKQVFLPDANKTSLAVIGAVGVSGPVLPVLEMQARVTAEVFAGRCLLPSKDDMVKEVERREQRLLETGFRPNELMRVNFITYLDDLASLIGVKPNLWVLFLDDPKLALRCFFGPCLPAQYRLQGPNSSICVRTIINSLEDDYRFPLRARECSRTSSIEKGNRYFFILYAVTSVFVILLVFLY